MSPELDTLATKVLQRARDLKLLIATAESCTGGLVAAALTSIAGSSDVFESGFVTYSNEAKAGMLGVDPDLIREHGAVSSQVALAKAACTFKQNRANVSDSMTFIAVPDGGT